jgi:hypothetical protein
MYCRCGNQIPEARIRLGYRECVNCSTIEQVGCIDIVYHKTGNTIQITDKETAEKMRQLSRRTGFGTLRGMKPGKKSDTYKPLGKIKGSNLMTRAVLPDPKIFEEAGATAMDLLETEGYDSALKWLQKQLEDLRITPVQLGKIRNIISALKPPPELTEPMQVKRSVYSKLEPKQIKSEVDEDIINIFKYWKR